MAKARNMIIDGYKKGTQLQMDQYGIFYIFNGRNPLNKNCFESYKVLSEETSKDVVSTVGRGLVGSAIFGFAGTSASLTGKENKIYTIRIDWDRYIWKDRGYSILELDQDFYKMFMIKCVRSKQEQELLDNERKSEKYDYDYEKWMKDNGITDPKDSKTDIWWSYFDDDYNPLPEFASVLAPYRIINPKWEEYMKAQQQTQPADIASSNTTDIKSKLKELKSMFEEDLITEEEYNSKRQELLSKM